MSTDMITYLNYMATWASESDTNIDALISEQILFENLGDIDSESAVESEFQTLTNLATDVRNRTIAADATQIAADAAAVAALWSFGFSMAAFVALEAAAITERAVISSKSKDLNEKLKTVDVDISAKINKTVNDYVHKYKENNRLIVAKAPKGLDNKQCRSYLMQFMAQVRRFADKLDAATFRQNAEVADSLYNSDEITKVYHALDNLTLSKKSDADVKKYAETIKGLDFPKQEMLIVQNLSVGIMFYKLKIANTTIAENVKAAGFEVSEVSESAFEMMDAVGKFFTVVAVAVSVVDAVFEVLDIVEVVKQAQEMLDKLNGPIKQNYKDYYQNLKTSSQQYKAAIAKKDAA